MTDKERPKAIRMLIEANKAQRHPHVIDIESGRPVAFLTDHAVHIQGEAGGLCKATITVLPLLDIVAEAEVRFVCPCCKKPPERVEKKPVRIISNGIAIYSNLTITDFYTGKELRFISEFEADITTSEQGAKATAILSCIDVLDPDAHIGTFHSLNCSVPHGTCEYCERVIVEPHHKNCSCPDCSERKRQEYEALEEVDILAN